MHREGVLIVRDQLRRSASKGSGLMVNDPYNEPSVIEPNMRLPEFFQHIVRNSFLLKMFNEKAHFRMIAEAAILLVESKMGWVKMYNEGGSLAPELL